MKLSCRAEARTGFLKTKTPSLERLGVLLVI
jgi:hypothetical protein